jgi:hypothetical protein
MIFSEKFGVRQLVAALGGHGKRDALEFRRRFDIRLRTRRQQAAALQIAGDRRRLKDSEILILRAFEP